MGTAGAHSLEINDFQLVRRDWGIGIRLHLDSLKMGSMTLSNGSVNRIVASILIAVVALLGCLSLPTEEASKKVQEFELKMAAGPIGERILVSNHSSEPWENIVMIINEEPDGSGYKLTLNKFSARASLHFGMKSYRNSEGARFDPKTDWMKTLNVYADTPSGKGHWRSSYRKKKTQN